MRNDHTLHIARLLAAFALGICPAVAAQPDNAPPQVELTASGNLLLTKYTGLLELLRKDI